DYVIIRTNHHIEPDVCIGPDHHGADQSRIIGNEVGPADEFYLTVIQSVDHKILPLASCFLFKAREPWSGKLPRKQSHEKFRHDLSGRLGMPAAIAAPSRLSPDARSGNAPSGYRHQRRH